MARVRGVPACITAGLFFWVVAGCDSEPRAKTAGDADLSLSHPDGGGAGDDDAMPAPAPLVDDSGIPTNTACIEAPDAGIVLDLQLVEVKGNIGLQGLDAVPDCKQGLLISPATNPTRIHLVDKTATHVLPVDCNGNFRGLVPPGDYKVYTTVHQTVVGSGSSFSWAVTLAPSEIAVRMPSNTIGPFTVPFHTLTGKVTFNGKEPFAQLEGAAKPCFEMTLEEQRSGGVPGTRGFFNADCAGNFSVRVPAGKYEIDLMGPVAGKEALTRLAKGNWILNPGGTQVKGDTSMSVDVPLVKLKGVVNTNIPMPCEGANSRIDLRTASSGTIFYLPLCNGAFDGFVSPGSYTTTLVQDLVEQNTSVGSVRAPMGESGTFSVTADTDNLAMNTSFKAVTGSVYVDDALATNPQNSGTATVVFLGKRSSGFTGWVLSGKTMRYSAVLPTDSYDISVSAAQILPGGNHSTAKFIDINDAPPPSPLDVRLKTVVIRGEVRFGGGPPRADDCSGYLLNFQPDQAFGGINVTPTCKGGKMTFETRLYPGRYQIIVRRSNADTEFPVPNIVFSESSDNVVVDLKVLDERPVRGILRINGCLLRESASTCASTYTVTLREAKQGVAYVMAPAFQDQPFTGRALPGNYRASVRFSSTCAQAPFATVTSELALPGMLTIP